MPTKPSGMLEWYDALHKVTGAMARADWRLGKQQPQEELKTWGAILKRIAQEMVAASKKKEKRK